MTRFVQSDAPLSGFPCSACFILYPCLLICVPHLLWVFKRPEWWSDLYLCPAGECAQIAERLKKAVGNAAKGNLLHGQAAAVLGQQAASANPPGYEGDVEMQ